MKFRSFGNTASFSDTSLNLESRGAFNSPTNGDGESSNMFGKKKRKEKN
jgi:hypothetical protein